MTTPGGDYSWARPSPRCLWDAGWRFVVRYVSRDVTGKNMTPAEVDALLAAGLRLVTVWQHGDTAMLEGYDRGARDARDGRTMAAACGMPANRPIYFAYDADPRTLSTSQWGKLAAYLDGAASVLGRANVGVYGGYAVIDKLVPTKAAWGWQTRSWSGGEWSPKAHLQQHVVDTAANPVRLCGAAVDHDRAVTADYGQWGRVPMSTICPFASYRPLGGREEPMMAAHDIICAHTMVGYLTSTDPYFRTANGPGWEGTESHYGIGGKWGPDLGGGLDGKIWQWTPRERTADANYEGTPWVISIETADNAARPIQPWTNAQLASLVRLVAWECSLGAHAACPSGWTCRKGVAWSGIRVAIPPILIPDTKPGRRGIGYHRQGCEHSDGVGSHPGWLVEGGRRWSKSIGKDCPTQVRIDQLTDIVIPRVQATLRSAATPSTIPKESPKMFIASPTDSLRQYLVTDHDKVIISKGEDYRMLRGKGIPEVGEVSAAFLAMWPTRPVPSAEGP